MNIGILWNCLEHLLNCRSTTQECIGAGAANTNASSDKKVVASAAHDAVIPAIASEDISVGTAEN